MVIVFVVVEKYLLTQTNHIATIAMILGQIGGIPRISKSIAIPVVGVMIVVCFILFVVLVSRN